MDNGIKKQAKAMLSMMTLPLVLPPAYLFYEIAERPIVYLNPAVYRMSMFLRHGGWYRERLDKTIELLNLEPGIRVLEVGCGYGIFSKRLIDRGVDLTAIDVDDRCINKLYKQHGGIFQKGDVSALEFEDESFDRVVMFDVLHHVAKSEKAVDEMYRILKPSGYAIIWEGSEALVEDYIAPKLGSLLVRVLDGDGVHDPELHKAVKKYGLENMGDYCFKLSKA
ncbi:MAG: methyltransferase domain-containing protein, partial [Candidatus Altiarchaeota archaeon]|nr:methyltransferase domain-containing protein [Candidatus Altiarchaeota archaeon]